MDESRFEIHRLPGVSLSSRNSLLLPLLLLLLLLSPSPCFFRTASLPVVPPHAQDLDHADEDIEKVEFEADALVDGVGAEGADLRHARVVENLLHVVQREAAEDGQAAVQPDVLGPHQRPRRSGGDHERRDPRERDDGDAGEQRSSQVQVLLLFRRRPDERDRAHHPDGVQTGSNKEGRVQEHQRRDDCGLGRVEGGPEGVLLNVSASGPSVRTACSRSGRCSLLRRSRKSAHHGAEARGQAQAKDRPGIAGHDTVAEPALMQHTGGDADDADAQAGMEEGIVEVRALKRRHATVLSRFPVEDQVDAEHGGSNETSSVEQTLLQISSIGSRGLVRFLHVRAPEGVAEPIGGLGDG